MSRENRRAGWQPGSLREPPGHRGWNRVCEKAARGVTAGVAQAGCSILKKITVRHVTFLTSETQDAGFQVLAVVLRIS